MNKLERCEYARSLKAAGKCNCAQAVVSALYDLTDTDLDTLLSTTSGFAVGMGNMEATCGALIGANIILGLIIKNGTVKYSKILQDKFKSKTTATICKIIKGKDTGVVLTECDMCVYYAVESLLEILEEIS